MQNPVPASKMQRCFSRWHSPIEFDCPLYSVSKGLSMLPSLSGQCCWYFQLADQRLKRGIYIIIKSLSYASDRILWLVFPQQGDNECVAFPVLAASRRHQCGVLESAGAAYPVLRSPQRQGCGLGPQEEWAYHQSQWPQQQSEWRKGCDSNELTTCHTWLQSSGTGSWYQVFLLWELLGLVLLEL